MNAPPDIVISAAEDQASLSPCGKSKRGAVIFRVESAGVGIYGVGFNGPPNPRRCHDTGKGDRASLLCRRFCGLTCAHAEQRAIRLAMTFGCRTALKADRFDLVHVKLGPDGKVVGGGKPSCEQCAVSILDVGFIAGVWLYEAPTAVEMETWERLAKGDSVAGPNPQGPPQARWRRYEAEEFLQATFEYRGLVIL